MIEVPPATSFEGRCLRYGAMTEWEYVWFRSKWAFAATGFALGVAVWEFTIGTLVSYAFAVILLCSCSVNVWGALRWRTSWQFWRVSLEWFFLREELKNNAGVK